MAKKKAKSAKTGKKAVIKKVKKKGVVPVSKTSKKPTAKKTAKDKKPVVKISKPAGKAKVKKPAKTTEKKVKDPVQLMVDAAVDGILEKKGRNITIMNLKKLQNRVCDYYIICQADSNTQVNAIAASVEEIVKKRTGEKPYRSEGFQNAEWILVDYVTVVVHIFQSHIRNFYNLESLWADADITELAFD